MGLKVHKARKDRRCDECGKRIAAGTRYWRKYCENRLGDTTADRSEHLNCVEHEREPDLPAGYNSDRSAFKK